MGKIRSLFFVDKLLEQDVIEPSVSPWRAQVLVTKDGANHKRRMVVDYSTTVNPFTHFMLKILFPC